MLAHPWRVALAAAAGVSMFIAFGGFNPLLGIVLGALAFLGVGLVLKSGRMRRRYEAALRRVDERVDGL